jgi:polysaccharide export outer membrane protein
MKPLTLLVFAVLVATLCCRAQDTKATAGSPATNLSPTKPSAPVPAAPANVDESTYVIGPLDVLAISVWKEQTLSGGLLVRPDGMISMPLIGDIQASNLTPLQLADQIALKLKKFIQDPNVTVVVSQIHSKVVYMLGEVGRKGPIEMTPEMTLLEAISIAGGPTDYANTKKIYILRSEAGKHIKIPVHYKEALKGDSSFNLLLRPDDTIVVP